MMIVGFFYSALVTAGLFGPSQEEQASTLMSFPAEHFRDTATLNDDELDTTAVITTEPGFQDKQGLLGIVNYDEFLRAFIDKKTGKAVFQIYEWQRYGASGWNFYQTVNFATPSGPQSESVDVLNRRVEDCSADGGCVYREDWGFDVPENLLRGYAADYAAGNRGVWLYKTEAKSGTEFKDGLTYAEIAGCLMVVDAYRVAHGLSANVEYSPPATTQNAPQPPPASPPPRQRQCTQQEEVQKRIAIKNGYTTIPNCQ
jgi:hypothetical protein